MIKGLDGSNRHFVFQINTFEAVIDCAKNVHSPNSCTRPVSVVTFPHPVPAVLNSALAFYWPTVLRVSVASGDKNLTYYFNSREVD